MFSLVPLCAGTVVGWYHGTLLHFTLRRTDAANQCLYGPTQLGTTDQRPRTLDFHIPLASTYLPEPSVSVVPSPFCCGTYFCEFRTYEVKDDGTFVRELILWQAECHKNAEFCVEVHASDAASPKDLASRLCCPAIVQVKLTEDILADTEILVEYGASLGF